MRFRRIGGLVVLFTAFLCVAAQASISSDYAGNIAGTVVDPTGQPAAGATVWLIVDQYGIGGKVREKTTADAAGRFEFPHVKLTLMAGTGEIPALVARDAKGQIGTERPWPLLCLPGEPLRPDIKPHLLAAKDLEGRLIDADGKPLAGATIAPQHFSSAPVGNTSGDEVELFPELSSELAAKTDSAGRFFLRGMPSVKSMAAVVTAPGVGSQRVVWLMSATPTIQLPRAGTIRGKAALPGSSAGIAGVPMCVRLWHVSPDEKWGIEYFATFVTDKAGQFTCKNVPSGVCHLGVLSGGDVPYYLPRDFRVVVKPGEATDVSVPLRRAVAVRGRVIDGQTKAGIPKIVLFANCTINEHAMQIFMAATDAHGKYTIYATPGRIAVYVAKIAGDYTVASSRLDLVSDDTTTKLDCPVIELTRGQTITGIVVDDHGQPVAGASVHTEHVTDNHMFTRGLVASDAAGKFTLKGVPFKGTLHIRACKGAAVSDPDATVTSATASSLLRLVISADKAVTLQGECLDTAGQPVPGADVSITRLWTAVGRSVATEHSQTDSAGRFQIQGLFPSDTHELRINADGHATFNRDSIEGAAGKTIDLGRLQLLSTRGQIEGAVLDSHGKPLAGVQVLNQSYTREPSLLTTDASGKFCLKGFLPGPAYVFATKDGYRFTGVRTQSGARDVTIKLLRKSESIPIRPRAMPVSALNSEQRQLARKILDHVWAACRNGNDRAQILLTFARLDPTVAGDLAGKLDGKAKTMGRLAIGFSFIDDDLDEALGWVSGDTEAACNMLFLSAERFERAAPAKALPWAEATVAHARAADQPMRTQLLATAAAVLGRSGANKTAGRKLAEEAAAMALSFKSDEKRMELCTPVGEALATYDVDRAMQFLKSIGDVGINNPECLVHVAAAAVTTDLAKARKILDQISGEEAETARARMAIRLASTQPAEAKRLLDGKWHNVALKAEALGWVALAAAPRDKQLACAAIDEALLLCNAPDTQSWQSHRQAVQAAILAAAARQIGHPDMEAVLNQALAARQPLSASQNEDETPAMALILSQADPDLARQLLLDLGDAADDDLSTSVQTNHALRLAALTLLDSKRANDLFTHDCAACKAGKVKDEALQELLSSAAEIITVHPADRLRYFANRLADSTLIEPQP
jgi:protocatechuate 3,4-dioxygenase beta subunit